MGKCYNVSFDSLTPTIPGTNLSSNQYYVNWASLMPDKPYRLTWSCMTATTFDLDVVIMGLMVNLGNSNTFSTYAKTGGSGSNYLGYLELRDTGATHYYVATTLTNPSIYLEQRPDQTMVMVQFTNGLDNTSFYSTPSPANYVLTLHFEEQG